MPHVPRNCRRDAGLGRGGARRPGGGLLHRSRCQTVNPEDGNMSYSLQSSPEPAGFHTGELSIPE